jgi:predicted PhzF superfamily epimerase YddE/YHI9
MKQLRIFQIDAFASQVFRGNPAAVCPLEKWLDDAKLQAIAQENNLAETAFFIPKDGEFHLRWFTPRHEVDLCGHATLAAAFVIFTEFDRAREAVRFESKSGPLGVKRNGSMLMMDFPALQMNPCEHPPSALLQGLGKNPRVVFSVDTDPNYFAVYESEEEVLSIQPSLGLFEQLHPYGVAVTAPGSNTDCASRYFAPSYGIPEDPATGSIHCALVPYWAACLNKTQIHARQVSARGGELFCEDKGDRVSLAGYAVKYLEGRIYV